MFKWHSDTKQGYKNLEAMAGTPDNFLYLQTPDPDLPPHVIPNASCFFSVRKINDQLEYHVPVPRDTTILSRIDSMKLMIEQAVKIYLVPDFSWIMICYDDQDWRSYTNDVASTGIYQDPECNLVTDNSVRDIKYPVFSASTRSSKWNECIPDFVYDSWGGAHIDSFDELTNWLQQLDTPALHDTLGWRGSNIIQRRKDLCTLSAQHDYDCKIVESPADWLSIKDQVLRWRFLIDLEGWGYSGRTKILLHAPRVLFMEPRTYQEDFYQWLKPWVHYVPIKSDLSDLVDYVDMIKNDPALESYIINNAQELARTRLTRTDAIRRLAEQLNSARYLEQK
jgi:hypothetical protein